MKNQKMNELSNEALFKKHKSLKIRTYILGGTLLVLFCVTTISTIMEYYNPLRHANTSMVTLIILLPILIVNFKNLNEIKKELKSRSLA
jgi:hypothetical protein